MQTERPDAIFHDPFARRLAGPHGEHIVATMPQGRSTATFRRRVPEMRSALFIGVGGHLVAVDPATGAETWRTKLKAASFVTVFVSNGRVFAGAGGELFCVDPATGQVIWRNRLPRLGTGVVAFPGSSSEVAAAGEREAAAAATVVAAT
jgi:hypothetical protein